MTNDDAEAALDELKNQRRTNTEAASEDDTETPDLSDAVADALRAIDTGDMNSTFGFRDERLVALLHGLEESGNLERLVTEAHHTLDRNGDQPDPSRSAAARLLLRIGIQSVDADILDDARDGYEQFMLSQADEF